MAESGLRRVRVAALSFAVILFSWTLPAHAARPVPRLGVDAAGDRIAVARATPGGKVLVIGFEKAGREFSRVYRRIEREGVAAADGTARLPLPPAYPVVPDSFWVAVDLASGDYGIATGDGRNPREGELPPADIKRDSAGRLREVVTRFDSIYMLVIRPGVAAWDLTTGDGGPADADGQVDGRIDLVVGRLSKRGSGLQDFDEYRDGDLIFVFVPRQMGYVLAAVKK